MIQIRGLIKMTTMGKHIQIIVHTKNVQSHSWKRLAPRTLIKNPTITNSNDDKADIF